MMKLQKIPAILLGVIVIFTIAGCGSDISNAPDSAPVDSSATESQPPEAAAAPVETAAPADEDDSIMETKIISDFPEALMIENIDGKGLEEYNTLEITPEVFFRCDAQIRSAILIHDNTLYFGNENSEFYAVDITSGEALWVYTTDMPVQTLPVIASRAIVFNAGDSLYILDAETGVEIHKITYVSESTTRISDDSYAFNDSLTAVTDGVAYYSTLDGEIIAVDIDKGETLWSYKNETAKTVTAGINFHDGKLYYIDGKGTLCCLDVQTQFMLFQVELKDGVYAPMTIDGGNIYLGGRKCKTYCIDADSGEVLWSSYSYDKTTWFSGGSVVSGNTLYACTSDEKTIIAFNKDTGEFQRLYPTGTNAYTKPLLNGENIIVAATDVYSFNESLIMEFDAQNHVKLWEASLEDCVLSAPAIYQGVLYFGSDSGAVYCIDLEQTG